MNIYEIVMKLNGPVQATGMHGKDQERLRNMKELTHLSDRLLFEVSSSTCDAERHEASMKAIGVHARDFLQAVKDS